MSIYVNTNGQQSSIPTLGILQQDKMQFNPLPTPCEELKNRIYQYTGESATKEGDTFNQGFFYVCRKFGNEYKWCQLDLYELFLNNAFDITFDNNNTDIDSNNVYGALIELSENYFDLLLEIA